MATNGEDREGDMDNVKKGQLASLLQRLGAFETSGALREETKNFLATVDAADISSAEKQLIDAGLAPEDLRHLCSVHMEMLSGEVEQMKAKLQSGHVIHTLVSEHEMILGFLDRLEEVGRSIQGLGNYDACREEFALLTHIAEHLVGAEPHHQREEEVLFPELERRGISGPPTVMRMEHTELRRRKHDLVQLAEGVSEMNFADFKKRLAATAGFIVAQLRDHIFKENNILYPMALEAISDEETWRVMKERCDQIGYCCFTPNS